MEILRDPDLSMKERGLLCTFYSFREDWHFSLEGMTRILCDGISSIKSAFNSLLAKGYVVKKRTRTEMGRLGEVNLYLVLPKTIPDVPQDGFPPVIKPSLENHPEEYLSEEKISEENLRQSKNYISKNHISYPRHRQSAGRKKNSFHNFKEREYDFIQLEKDLLEAQEKRLAAENRT